MNGKIVATGDKELAHELEHHHRIGHPTIQIETTRANCGAGC